MFNAGRQNSRSQRFPDGSVPKSMALSEKEMLDVFTEFFEKGYLDWRLNLTFIMLIPKIEGEKEIYDFSPISLLSGVYKILGKTIAIRLNDVLGDLISNYQCGGLPGCQIHDGILIANEFFF